MTIFLYDLLCPAVAIINDTFYLFINHGSYTFAVSSGCMCKITSDKYFVIVIVIIDESHSF